MTPSKTINIRASKKEKAYLIKCASEAGKTLSAYLREAAIAEAHRVLENEKQTKTPKPRHKV